MNWDNQGLYNRNVAMEQRTMVGTLIILFHYQLPKLKRMSLGLIITQIYNHCVVIKIELSREITYEIS